MFCPCFGPADVVAADFGLITVSCHRRKSAGIEPLGARFSDVLLDIERGGAVPCVGNFSRWALTMIGPIRFLALVITEMGQEPPREEFIDDGWSANWSRLSR